MLENLAFPSDDTAMPPMVPLLTVFPVIYAWLAPLLFSTETVRLV